MPNTKEVLKNGQKIKNLKKKLQYGDYTTLSDALGCKPEAAKKRFLRGNDEAFNALEKIVLSRQEVVREISQKNQ